MRPERHRAGRAEKSGYGGLLLLVDVSGSVSANDFSTMMTAYGNAMTSQAVLDAIQCGQRGRIATSVLFWASDNRQAIGVEWMEVSGISSARSFQSSITTAARPFEGTTAIGTAIRTGTPLFGTETGGVENGFESVTQIINVAGDGIDNASNPRVRDRSINVSAARDNALANGVDIIGGIAVNDATGDLDTYYRKFVIGGGTETMTASVARATTFADFERELTSQLAKELKAGSTASVSAVPEPASTALITVSSLLIFRRNRRKNHPQQP